MVRYNNLRLQFFKVFLLILLASVHLLFTSFNTLSKNQIDHQNQIIVDWYDLYLELESKDPLAYPPISGERLSQLGIAGYLTHNIVVEKSQEDEMLFLNVYNKLFCHLLKEIFNEKVFNSHRKTEELQNKNTRFLNPTTKDELKAKQYVEIVLDSLQSIKKRLPNKVDLYFENPAFTENNLQYQKPEKILPEWGMKPTWIISREDFRLDAPYSKNISKSDAIKKDALSVYSVTSQLSKEEKWIAEFWSDDVRGLTFSPLSRWYAVANQILNSEKMSIKDLIHIYFKLGVGLNDAAIMTWHFKYHYNILRPSDYITKNLDQNWKPFHSDPNFPSYPSGHAVFGAVASSILETYVGENYYFTDNSHENRKEFLSKKRSFPSLDAMAKESAWSRILLGVHFYEDCDAGLKYGQKIGKYVSKNAETVFLAKFFDLNSDLSKIKELN